MKKALFLFLFFISTLHAEDYCPIQMKGDEISKLAKELKAACDWSIQKLAKEKIITDCQKAKKKDPSISFRKEYGETTLHFTQYGDTYKHSPHIECKHNKAYQIRLNQLIHFYTQEAQTGKRSAPPRQTSSTNSSRGKTGSTTPPPPPKVEKVKLWRCRIPNYIRTFKTVGEEEKNAIENAHGNVCLEYRGSK